MNSLDQVVPWGRSFEEYQRMVDEFREQGFNVSIESVPFEFQRGGNQMMRIRRAIADG